MKRKLQGRTRRRGSLMTLERLDRRCLLAAVNWTGGGDGSHWTDPNNWSTLTVPTSSDDVTINAPSTTVLVDNSAVNAGTLTLDSALSVTNYGSLTISTGQLSMSGGTINLGASDGSSYGSIYFEGTDLPGGASIIGAGTIAMGPNSGNTIYDELYASATNTSGGILTIGTGITIHGAGEIYGYYSAAQLQNHGTISADQTTSTFSVSLPVQNYGSMSVTNGATLNISGVTNAYFGRITATSGTLGLSGAWSNLGTITATNATVNFSGSFSQAAIGSFGRTGGVVNLSGGTLSGNLTLAAADGTWYLAGATLTSGTYSGSGGGQLIATSGTLDGYALGSDLQVAAEATNGSVHVTNSLALAGGNLLIGPSDTSAYGTVFLDGSDSSGQQIDGSGSIIFGGSSGNGLANDMYTTRGDPQDGLLVIGSGVTITGIAGTISSYSGVTSSVDLQGAMVVNGSIGASITATEAFTNDGTVTATGGATLTFSGSLTNNGLLTVDSSTLTIDTGTLANTGSIVSTNSTVSFGGTLSQYAIGNFIRTGGSVTLTYGTFTGSLNLSGATGVWILNGATLQTGAYSAYGGGSLLVVDGTMDNYVLTSDLTVGTGSTSGALTIEGGLDLSGGNLIIGGAGSAFNGTLIASGQDQPGGVSVTGSGTITIGASPGNSIQNELSSSTSDPTQTALTFTSGVTVVATSGTIVDYYGSNSSSVAIDGPLMVGGAGSFTVSTTANVSGPVTVTGGATLTFSGTTVLSGTVTVTAASLTFDNGTITNVGSISATNATVSFGGSLTQASLLNYTHAGGETDLITGTLTGNLALSDATGSYVLAGITLRGGTYSATGSASLSVRSGTLDGYALASDMLVGASDGAQLHVLNGLTLVGGATLTVGSSDGSTSAALYFDGSNYASGQTISGAGTITFGGSASASAADALYNGIYTNGSTGSYSTALTIGPGITLNLNSGSLGAYYSSYNESLVIAGKVLASGSASGTSYVSVPTTLSSTGSVTATSGTVSFSAGLSNLGTLSIAGGEVDLSGSVTSLSLGTVVRSSGVLAFQGTLTGNLALSAATGDLVLQYGTIRNGTISTSGGAQLLVNDGTLDNVTIAGDVRVATSTSGSTSGYAYLTNGLTFSGGTLTLGAPSTAGGTGGGNFAELLFSGANLASGFVVGGTGQIQVASGTSADIYADLTSTTSSAAQCALTFGPGVTISGSDLSFSGASGSTSNAANFVLQGAMIGSAGANGISALVPFTLAAGSTVTADTTISFQGGLTNLDATGNLSGGSLVAENGGLITLPTGTTISAISTSVTIRGSASGILDGFYGASGPAFGGVLAIRSGGSLTLDQGASLSLGTLSNLGALTVTNGSSLSASGSFSTSGSLTVGIGTNATSGSLSITGGAALGGTLHLSLLGGFDPVYGTAIGFLQAGSISGTFASVSADSAADGHSLTATYGATSVTAASTAAAPIAVIGGADPTFGGGGSGVVVTTIPQAQIVSIDSLTLASGQVLSAGLDATNNAIVLTRFNANGSTDTTFGASGVLRATLPVGFTAGRVQFDVTSGALYVTGTLSASSQPAAIRMTQGGIVDTSFGTAGILTISPLRPGDQAYAIVPADDKLGGYIVGGAMTVAGVRNSVVLRVLANGTLNVKFGVKGYYLRPGGALDAITGLAFGAKAIIYATGLTSPNGGVTTSTLAIRLTAAGKYDKTFGPGTFSIPGVPLSSGVKVSVQSDGKVLFTSALATSAQASGTGIALVRLTTKGTFDPTFNGVGYFIVKAAPATVSSSAVLVSNGVVTAVSGGAQQLFDDAAASMATIPGGKVREIAATAESSGDSTIVQTQVVADAIDLIAGAVTLSAKKPYKPKTKLSLTLKVSDTGTLPTPATAPVALYFSSNPVLDSADVQEAVAPVKLSLKAGTSKSLSIAFTTPTTAGTYFVIVVLNSGAGAFQNLNAVNDTAVAPAAITVAGITPKVTPAVAPLIDPDPSIWDRLFGDTPILA